MEQLNRVGGKNGDNFVSSFYLDRGLFKDAQR